jgi:hypothetical protein
MTTLDCPKCHQGKIYTRRHYSSEEMTCPACGLFYEAGSNRESLKRQITGSDPVEVQKRAMALKGMK